jgi:hypothetical protein
MNSYPTPLYVQDVIELLTNIKLKHGNLPVYYVDFAGDLQRLVQDNGAYRTGVNYQEPYTSQSGKAWDLPERVEIT